ncbi:MAG: hypothetical protein ACRDJF_01790 [Actinomycetota bacterium]
MAGTKLNSRNVLLASLAAFFIYYAFRAPDAAANAVRGLVRTAGGLLRMAADALTTFLDALFR